jgi:tRNA (guanine37-N1)-methyltransferase
LIARAISKKIITVNCYDLRDFSTNKHRKVDDRPFGGGAGMVMTPQPLFDSINHIQKKKPGKVILFSAYAEPLTQKKLIQLSKNENHLILVCGRYEGIDQRVIDTLVDEEISIGSYVIMGGESAAQVLIEGISRMFTGVIGNLDSVETDSFFKEDQYGFPQYTQPRNYKGLEVPEVLLTGNHNDIAQWRKKNQKWRKK